MDDELRRVLRLDELEGTRRCLNERMRQISEEGWTPEHDDHHMPGELTAAGICYLQLAERQLRYGDTASMDVPLNWPGSWEWKPSSRPQRNLERGAALCMAESDRHLTEK